MQREQELEHVLKLIQEAKSANADIDVAQLVSRYQHLMPELQQALERVLEVRGSSPQKVSEAHVGDAASTIDHAHTTHPEASPPAQLRYIGEYRLESLLGRGAFGEVWRATQVSLNRCVAVKLLLPQHCTPALLQRFNREAEVLAQLRHHNIVNVLEVNADQGRHYIAMEFVDGVNFKQVIERGLPACRWVAEQMRTLAKAIAHAHAANVIHRDLKPANLLLSVTDELKVTDFGLAKRVASDSELTLDGTVLGTLAYMPPEQALGKSKDVGPSADVYAIGATLYHLLTGRPPFPTQPDLPAAAIYNEIRDTEPIPPRQLRVDRLIPRDLETICLKCLAKEPQGRYASAQALADDLERYLAGDPIEARPVSWGERLWLRVKKRPVIATLVTVLSFTLATAAILATRGRQLAEDVVTAQQSLENQSAELIQTKVAKSQADTLAAQARQEQEVARLLALQEAERRTLQEYLADMNESQELWERGELGRLRDLLAKYEQPSGYDPRGFEWHFLRKQLAVPAPWSRKSAGSPWNRLAFNADSSRLAGMDRDGTLVAWDLKASQECYRVEGPAHSFAYSAKGQYCLVLRTAEKGDFQLFAAESGELLQQFNAGALTTCFALHPEETKIVTANSAGEIFLRELPSGKLIQEITAEYKDRAFQRRSLDIEHGAIFDVAFSPSGDSIAVGWEDGTVQVWHLESRRIDRRIDNPHAGPVIGLAFSPQGNLLASQSAGSFDRRQDEYVPGDVKITLLATGGKLSKLVPHTGKLTEEIVLRTEHGAIPFGLFRPAFSMSGEQLFTTGSPAVSRWNVRSGEREVEYPGHDGLVYAVAVSPDGRHVAGAGQDNTIRVWPSAGATPYKELCRAHGGIHSLALSADERHLAAIGDRGIELRVPDIRTGLLSKPRRLTDPTLWVWNGVTGEKRYSEDVELLSDALQFNKSGLELWSCGNRYRLDNDSIEIQKPDTGLAYGTLELAGPDQSFIVRYSRYKPVVELSRPEAAKPYATLEKHTPHASIVCISPDGKRIATGGADHLICLWSSDDGKLLHECRGHAGEITSLAFSPDSAHLLSGGLDKKLYAWEVASGQRVGAFPGHRREISGLAFTADGTRFASSSGSLRVSQLEQGDAGEVRLWDFASRRLCIELKADQESYSGVAISRDGQRIFAAANTLAISPGRIVVWDGTPERQ